MTTPLAIVVQHTKKEPNEIFSWHKNDYDKKKCTIYTAILTKIHFFISVHRPLRVLFISSTVWSLAPYEIKPLVHYMYQGKKSLTM